MIAILRSCALAAWFVSACAWPIAAQVDEAAYVAAREAYRAGEVASAVAVLEPMARAGHPGARNILADAYDRGNGVERDTQRALDLYRAAAAQGYAPASYHLGVLLSEGRPGIPSDIAQAIVHYEDAMDQDFAAAFTRRGLLHLSGNGGAVDAAQAVAMFRRGNDLGDPDATDNLANLMLLGEGVERDEAGALALWRAAAARGHGPSINQLGRLYENGIVVMQDPVAAFALYRLAADRGAFSAGLNLAGAYADGSAPRRDDTMALAWCLWSQDRAPIERAEEVAAACATRAGTLSAEDTARARAIADTLTP